MIRLIIIVVLAGCLVFHLYTDQHHCQTRASNVSTLASTVMADDDLFRQIFGPEWSRSKPMFQTRVKVTVYNSERQQTDSSPYTTGDGTTVRYGILAISDDLRLQYGLRMGQRVLLTGYGMFEVRDAMNPRWRKRVDIWSADKTAARLHGVRDADLIWFGR